MRRTTAAGLFAALLALGCGGGPVPENRPRSDNQPPSPTPAAVEPTPAADTPLPEWTSETNARTLTWHVGVVRPGAELRRRFVITNNSSFPWTVAGVRPSCSCTVGKFSPESVGPSESTAAEVVFRAGAGEGDVAQTLVVTFREPQAPEVWFVIAGQVREQVAVVPPVLELGTVAGDARLERTAEVRNYGDKDVTVTRVEAPAWLRAEVKPAGGSVDGARQTWKLAVEADLAKYRPGNEAPVLVLHTDSPRAGALRVPVYVQVKAALTAVPGFLAFDPVAPGQTARKLLLLEAAAELGEDDLRVTHDLGDAVAVQVAKLDAPRRFKLTVQYQPKQAGGRLAGELVIQARGGSGPPVRVPVFAQGP
jgi:hypothetical protein